MTEISGKAKGGIARRDALTARRRKAIAKKAADARWSDDIKEATHGSPDHPLRIGDIEIPCYVLEDETRVLAQRGMISGLGMARGSAGGGDRLVSFIGSKGLSAHVNNDLAVAISNPIKFKTNGIIAYGYPATILADICDAVLSARQADALSDQQQHIAERCEILVRGFARVGIIALVDEATGYQRDRAKDALSKILEAFIAKEIQPYLPTFPADYYEQLFRLRGLKYPVVSGKRPQYLGMLTNDIVYKRIAPGVLEELKRVTPKDETGRHKQKLFQRLTSNIGYPKLREHLGGVIATMKLSKNYADFIGKLDTISPRYDKTLPLPLLDPDEDKDD